MYFLDYGKRIDDCSLILVGTWEPGGALLKGLSCLESNTCLYLYIAPACPKRPQQAPTPFLSRNMVSRVQLTDIPIRPLVPLEDLLQPLDILPTELSRLVPSEIKHFEPDARRALVFDISLFLEPQLLLRELRSTHLEKMDYGYARSSLRPGTVMEGI